MMVHLFLILLLNKWNYTSTDELETLNIVNILDLEYNVDNLRYITFAIW